MREIKFKLWNDGSKQWVYGLGKAMVLEVGVNRICQFTGVKDRDGREIYEGDIISERHFDDWGSTEDHEYRGVVYWSSVQAGFFSLPVPDESSIGHKLSSKCLVVGNIYDNPNLTERRVEKTFCKFCGEEVWEDKVEHECSEKEEGKCGDDLSECEQCGEDAWDGGMCHSCGLKDI